MRFVDSNVVTIIKFDWIFQNSAAKAAALLHKKKIILIDSDWEGVKGERIVYGMDENWNQMENKIECKMFFTLFSR